MKDILKLKMVTYFTYALAFLVVGLMITDVTFIEKEYNIGRYLTVVSEFDEDAIQETHTAKVRVGSEVIDINVLSDFEEYHTIDTDIVIYKKVGYLTGQNYGYRVTNQDTEKFIKLLKGK